MSMLYTWRLLDDCCDECGGDAEGNSDNTGPADGDSVRCRECGYQGTYSDDGEDTPGVDWDHIPECGCKWCVGARKDA